MKRPIRIDGDVAYVPLTKGYTAVIDASDVSLVADAPWFAKVDKRHTGEVRTVYAIKKAMKDGKRCNLSMHRLIIGDMCSLTVDHVDGDGLNNRRANLRQATLAQNQHNQRKRKDNLSGYKGVAKCSQTQKWTAQIMVDGVRKWLGRFGSPAEAGFAYAEASKELHGEFGRLK